MEQCARHGVAQDHGFRRRIVDIEWNIVIDDVAVCETWDGTGSWMM